MSWAVEKQLHTAHISNSVRIHYPHHPHFGELVQVIRTSSAYGPNQADLLLPSGKRLFVPTWMLDEGHCKTMQISDQPIVAVSVLFALRDLLQSQRLAAETNVASSGKPLPGGVSLEAEPTRNSLRRKNNSAISRNGPAALSRVTQLDVPSRDRRKSKKQRGRKK